jgi:hypothetical protein
MFVLDVRFNRIQQISSHVEIIGSLVQRSPCRQVMSELGQKRRFELRPVTSGPHR